MRPLFAVGELVTIQSQCHPEMNGIDTIILECKAGRHRDVRTGRIRDSIAYECEVMPPWANGKPVYWNESALRKKPKPSDYSFDELIREINDTVIV